jgi:hypothetical protein
VRQKANLCAGGKVVLQQDLTILYQRSQRFTE